VSPSPKSLVANNADAQQVRRAGKMERSARQIELAGIKRLFGDDAFRKLMWKYLEKCNVLGTSYCSGDALATAYNEGMRMVGNAILNDLLGVPARRKLGAGRRDDMGDIDGVPDTCIQVANRKDVAAAVREKPVECERQQARAGDTFGATFIRLRGGDYRVVLTPEQWATYVREAQ